jgi:hypothetical protein
VPRLTLCLPNCAFTASIATEAIRKRSSARAWIAFWCAGQGRDRNHGALQRKGWLLRVSRSVCLAAAERETGGKADGQVRESRTCVRLDGCEAPGQAMLGR